MEKEKKKIMKVTLRLRKNKIFLEWPDQFQRELVEDLFKLLEHKNTEHPYVEPQVQDAETIRIKTKKENNELFDLA